MRLHPEAVPLDFIGLPVLLAGVPLLFLLAPRYRPAFLVLLVAYVTRAAAAGANYFVLPAYDFDADWTFLDGVARSMAGGGVRGWLASFDTGREMYSWLAAFSYLTVGRSPFLLIALNVVIGTLVVLAVYGLARELGASRRTALVPMLGAAFFPTLVAYCVQPSREPLVTLAFTVAILATARWFRRRRPWDLAACGGGMLLAGLIHSSFVLVLLLAVAFLASEYLVTRWRDLQAFASWLVVTILAVMGAAAIAVTGFGLGKVGFDLGSVVSLEAIADVTDKSDIDSRAAYVDPEDVVIESYGDVAAKLPRRVALFLFKPYPWEVRSVTDVVGVLVAGTVVVAAGAFLWRRRSARPLTWSFLAVVLGAQLLMFSWGTVNYGTATRHKSKFVPVLLVLLVAPTRHRHAAEGWEPGIGRDVLAAAPTSRGAIHRAPSRPRP